MSRDPAIKLCMADFNETNWGWDTCTREKGHSGSHHDDSTDSWGHNSERDRRNQGDDR